MSYSIREAKSQFSAVCDAAHNGETIVITKNGKPWADVVPHQQVYRTCAPIPEITGSISMADLLAPMDEETLALWEGSSDAEDTV